MPCKVSYYFRQVGDRVGGWSENFWHASASPTDALTAGVAIQDKLMECHGRQSVLSHVSARFDGKPRNTRINRYPNNVINPSSSSESDYQTTAVCLEMVAGFSGRTRQWIKGVYDAGIHLGGVVNQGSVFWTRLQAFISALIARGGFGLRLKDQAQLKKHIEALTTGGVVTVTAHGYLTGDMVLISGMTYPTYANGVWRIGGVTPNAFTLKRYFPPSNQTDPAILTGTAQRIVHTFAPLTAVNALYASSRKVGRPFGLLIGRRKRRR